MRLYLTWPLPALSFPQGLQVCHQVPAVLGAHNPLKDRCVPYPGQHGHMQGSRGHLQFGEIGGNGIIAVAHRTAPSPVYPMTCQAVIAVIDGATFGCAFFRDVRSARRRGCRDDRRRPDWHRARRRERHRPLIGPQVRLYLHSRPLVQGVAEQAD